MASTEVGTYRCAVHLGAQRFAIRERRVRATADTVVIKVLSAGVCGTDLAITATPPEFEAPPSVVLGHEIVGTVVSQGPTAGKTVIVVPTIYCGTCPMCIRHQPSQCLNPHSIGIDRDGGFAEYVLAPKDRLLEISEELERRTAVLAEPLACVLHGIARTPGLVPNGVSVVLGAGPIGALFALVLERVAGQRVIVSEPGAARASLAASRLERGRVVLPADLASAVADETDGIGADVVIDAVGSMLAVAVEVAAPYGTVHAFGLHDRPIREKFQQRLTVKELTVTTAYGGGGYFERAAELLERGVLSATDLVSDVFPLDEIGAAFDAARDGTGLKVLIEPGLSRKV
jgi:threonine dehydrogenase-like Zn-dependent dehydrogenase